MSTDALAPPLGLIDLSKYNLAELMSNEDKPLSAALLAAIERVTANAEDEDASRVCAFNSAL